MFMWLLGSSYATHEIYIQDSIILNMNTPLIAGIETFNLSTPVPLIPNHRYGIILESKSPGVIRNYMGATGLNSGECALVHASSNNSWVSPISNYVAYSGFDFFLRINGALDLISLALSLQSVPLPTWADQNGTGFGQTFNSGSLTSLLTLGLQLAPNMNAGNILNVTLKLYDLSNLPILENVAFLFYQETAISTY